MTYGITGNTGKEKLWKPAAELVRWMIEMDIGFSLTPNVSRGLLERNLLTEAVCHSAEVTNIAEAADIILSFGGDGTFLATAHQVKDVGTPILGVNIGRLGFLAAIEATDVRSAIEEIEGGRHSIDHRTCLEATVNDNPDDVHFALNEFVLERSGRAGLIAIDVWVNGASLNNYWADGIIISTPTGSTAYSLSVGGPIVTPGAEIILVSPIASHSLTVRPIVLEDRCTIRARIETERQSFVLAADGRSTEYSEGTIEITVRKAPFTVNLIRLPGHHYFKTLRNKLMWGIRKETDLR